MAAAQCLRDGDWERTFALLGSLSVWELVPLKSEVLAMLELKIKQEALRTYMLTYSSHYNSMKQSQLCELFGLEKNVVHSITSKMMIAEELHASCW